MHPISLPSWFESRAFFRFDSIDPRKTALVSVDMQVAFVQPGLPIHVTHAADVVANSNRLIAALRAAGGTIAFTRHTVSNEAPYVLPDFQRHVPLFELSEQVFQSCAPGHGVDPGMDCRAGDIVVDKYRISAFLPNSSDLHAQLHQRGIDTLIITGVATNVCCESAARDASMMGYKIFFIADATATFTDEEHNATLLNVGAIFGDVRTADSMLALIEASGAAKAYVQKAAA